MDLTKNNRKKIEIEKSEIFFYLFFICHSQNITDFPEHNQGKKLIYQQAIFSFQNNQHEVTKKTRQILKA